MFVFLDEIEFDEDGDFQFDYGEEEVVFDLVDFIVLIGVDYKEGVDFVMEFVQYIGIVKIMGVDENFVLCRVMLSFEEVIGEGCLDWIGFVVEFVDGFDVEYVDLVGDVYVYQ